MPLSKSRGKIHEYLGMIFDYTKPGKVHISMYQHINGLLNNIPPRYKEGVGSATPAPSHLYDIRDPEQGGIEYLNTNNKDEYHSLTAQFLYLSKRGRPDL